MRSETSLTTSATIFSGMLVTAPTLAHARWSTALTPWHAQCVIRPVRLSWLASAQWLALVVVQAAAAQTATDLAAPGSLAAELSDPAAIAAPRDIVFDATFGTSLPLSVGIEGRLETSFGLTAHACVGH